MSSRARQRDHVLVTIEAADGPVDASHVAEVLDLHVSTARFHLNKLINDGLVVAVPLPSTSVGRPRTGYSTSLPKPELRLIGLLVESLGDDEESRRAAAVEIGRRWAAPTLDHHQDSAAADPVQVIESTLTKLGFEVQSTSMVADVLNISICSCTLHDVTRTDPAVSYSIIEGVLDQVLAVTHPAPAGFTTSVLSDFGGTSCVIMVRLTPAQRA